jgi:hypothetical protein
MTVNPPVWQAITLRDKYISGLMRMDMAPEGFSDTPIYHLICFQDR